MSPATATATATATPVLHHAPGRARGLAPVIELRRREPAPHDWTLAGIDYEDDGRAVSEYRCRGCGEIDFR